MGKKNKIQELKETLRDREFTILELRDELDKARAVSEALILSGALFELPEVVRMIRQSMAGFKTDTLTESKLTRDLKEWGLIQLSTSKEHGYEATQSARESGKVVTASSVDIDGNTVLRVLLTGAGFAHVVRAYDALHRSPNSIFTL